LENETQMSKASRPHDEWLSEQLQDLGFATQYLSAAAEDPEPAVFLSAMRNVAEARGGMAKIAKAAGLSRESLYRALSSRGNPSVKTFSALLKAMGFKMAISPLQRETTTGQIEQFRLSLIAVTETQLIKLAKLLAKETTAGPVQHVPDLNLKTGFSLSYIPPTSAGTRVH
jgi:probable addiction module antidote protein